VADPGDRVRKFVAEELLYEKGSATIADDTPLLPLIDSLGLTQLVAFIEEEFSVELDDADITSERFRTIADIEALIGEKAARS
jgi:acyl carrier protein